MTAGTICRNCGASFTGTYCPHCGQQVIRTFTWRFVAASIIESFDFNKGLLFNLKQFTLQPRDATTKYLDGATRQYMNPVSYCVVGISLLFISIQFLHPTSDEELYKQAEQVTYLFVAFFPFVFSLILLGAAIGLKRNYLYGLIVALFFTGHNLILLIFIKVILFTVNLLVSLDIELAVLLFVVISVYYSIKFTQAFLNADLASTSVRLLSSTLATLTFLFVAIGILFTRFETGTVNELGQLIGRVTVVVFSFR